MASTQKETTFTKIFVGGLPYHTTDQSLRLFFEQFGEIDEAVVITDRLTEKSRGYGFVTMADRIGAEKACEDPNPIIDGRKANVNLAYLGAKPRATPSGGFPLMINPVNPTNSVQGFSPNQMMPQYVYPPSAFMHMPAHGIVPMSQPQHSPPNSSPSLLQHSPVAAAAFPSAVSQLSAAYQAAGYPYATTANYINPSMYSYMAAAAFAQQQQQQQQQHHQQQQQQSQLAHLSAPQMQVKYSTGALE